MVTILEKRIELEMRQSDLAKLAKVSIPVISRMENGEAVLKSSFLAVCKALSLNPDDVEGVDVLSWVQVRARQNQKRKSKKEQS